MKFLIGLGSNLGDRARNLMLAADRIEATIGKVVDRSGVYCSKALVLPGENPSDHPDFLNAVVAVNSELAPDALLERLLSIERDLGRVRHADGRRWAPRIIDLDIIAAESLVVDSPCLRIPHPEMHRRNFVLVPLAEIASQWVHPVTGLSAAQLVERLDGEAADKLERLEAVAEWK